MTGVDLSSALIDAARRREEDDPLAIRYVCGDIAAADFDAAAFDVVVCAMGLADIDNADGAIAAMARVLRDRGAVVWSILHPCFPGAGDVSGSWPPGRGYFHEGWWRAEGASSTLRQRVGANHRMLSTYLNMFTRQGLILEEMVEPPPSAAWVETRHEVAGYPLFTVARHRVNGGRKLTP